MIQGVHVTTMRGSVRIYIHMYIYTERVRPYIHSYIFPRGLGRTDPHHIPPRTSRTPAINPMMHCVLICPPRAALAGRTACIAAQQRGSEAAQSAHPRALARALRLTGSPRGRPGAHRLIRFAASIWQADGPARARALRSTVARDKTRRGPAGAMLRRVSSTGDHLSRSGKFHRTGGQLLAAAALGARGRTVLLFIITG